MCHRTTWQAPFRKYTMKNGEKRRNPIRNQIDYAIVRNKHLFLVTDSRSYGGIKTETDHKFVKMIMRLDWHKMKTASPKEPKLCIDKLSDENIRKTYHDKLKANLSSTSGTDSPNENQIKWPNLANTCKETAKEILGVKSKTKKSSNPEIKSKSSLRHELRLKMINCKNENKLKDLKSQRRSLLSDIRKLLKSEKEQEVKADLENLENCKNDSNKYHQVNRELRNKTPKQPIYVADQNGNVPGTTDGKINIIKEHFMNALAPDTMKGKFKTYQPTALPDPISISEVTKAVKSMKNGKSCGEDEVYVELIKYGPAELHQQIADILNNSHNGEYPAELTTGLLAAMQKPGKKKGPPENLRPIILLSVLRKILTIIMLKRIWPKLEEYIPISQAAYQGGRGTTEQVFSIKVLCEKAMTTPECTVQLLLLDMSKAFDTVDREKLFEHLESILDPGELYYLSILTNEPQIKIKLEGQISEPFTTTQGIMQGDCLSEVLFIFYLAKALEYDNIKIYAQNNGIFYIEPKYADDITVATINDNVIINKIEQEYPSRLAKYNLSTNVSKTEKYSVPEPKPENTPPNYEKYLKSEKCLWSNLDWVLPDKSPHEKTEKWKKCKLLGSKLDTAEDLKGRKGKALDAMKKLHGIFTSKFVSIQTKIKQFKTYVESVFMYNTELWTTTKTINKSIDSFHRRLLRRAINKMWPKRVYTNEELYNITNSEPWSKTITRRRLNFTGHLFRLDEKTPARLALNEFCKPAPRKPGRPPTTWLSCVRNDLKDSLTLPHDASELISMLCTHAQDREDWAHTIRRSIGRKSC